MDLQLLTQPVGGDRADDLPVNDHVERRAGWLAGSLTHPAAGDDAVDRLEDAVNRLWPKDQRRVGELHAIGEEAHRRSSDELLRRQAADQAAEAVMAGPASDRTPLPAR